MAKHFAASPSSGICGVDPTCLGFPRKGREFVTPGMEPFTQKLLRGAVKRKNGSK
jgi:hypothetical protein